MRFDVVVKLGADIERVAKKDKLVDEREGVDPRLTW